MTYKELLELTKNHPNPFSVNNRKTRVFDYQVRSEESLKERKPNKQDKSKI